MTIVSYRNRFTTLYVYALLLLLFVKNIDFKNERKKILGCFYWTWRDFGLLPTYPFKGSKFHVVLFQNVFVGWFNFSFENSFEERMRGRKGMRFGNK